jgi:uncharacterized protein (DUF934 family)
MALIKNGVFADDPWAPLDDAADPGEADHPIISLERWQANGDGLARYNGPLGIRLKADQPPALIAEDLERFDLVALEFPKFADGRAFTYARLLRERHGYTGELRATGDVLRDQYQFMLRCGFDAFEIADPASIDGWRQSATEITVWYQPAAEG